MNVIGINGSPRKQWNTATLVAKALEGAAAKGATTELVHLYDLDFKGCKSCFACKTRGCKSYGKCILNDELAPVLEKIAAADALAIGSPIYFGTAFLTVPVWPSCFQPGCNRSNMTTLSGLSVSQTRCSALMAPMPVLPA